MNGLAAHWRIALFLCIYGLLDYAYFLIPDEILLTHVYGSGLANVAALLGNWVGPEEGIRAAGHHIVSPLADLEIVRGCDGSGAVFLLLAAVLAARAPVRSKLLGLSLGAGMMYGANLLRVLVLYFVVAHARGWFLVVHTFIAPVVVILLGCLFFVGWSWSASPPSREAA